MRYRVIFFKNLLSFDGHTNRCLQQSIVIRRAKSIERAVAAAKRRYERRHCHVAGWRLHADGVELEIDPPSSQPRARIYVVRRADELIWFDRKLQIARLATAYTLQFTQRSRSGWGDDL
jgi:hypothetical protein